MTEKNNEKDLRTVVDRETTVADFGRYIPDSAKEKAYFRKLLKESLQISEQDLEGLSEEVKKSGLKKDVLWEKPDWESLYFDEGFSIEKVFYLKMIYDNLPAKPSLLSSNKSCESFFYFIKETEKFAKYVGSLGNEEFIEFMEKTNREDLFKQMSGIYILGKNMYGEERWMRNKDCILNQYGVASNTFWRKLRMNIDSIQEEIINKKFILDNREIERMKYEIVELVEGKFTIEKNTFGNGEGWDVFNKETGEYFQLNEEPKFGGAIIRSKYDGGHKYFKSVEFANKILEAKIDSIAPERDEKKATNRKKIWSPAISSETSYIRRGPKVLGYLDINGEEYLRETGLSGQSGKTLSDVERIRTMNRSYESFTDIASVAGITLESVSLGGDLGIAFGARGHGRAAAHYEPMNNVINLTKENGVGTLAHEWGHALSNYLRHNGMDKEVNECYDALMQKQGTTEEIAELRLRAVDRYRAPLYSWLTTYNTNKDCSIDKEGRERLSKVVDEIIDNIANNPIANSAITKDKFGSETIKAEYVNKLNEALKAESLPVLDDKQRTIFTQGFKSVEKESFRASRDTNGKVPTNYLRESQKFDDIYQKDGGYWSDPDEMLARVMDKYMHEHLKDMNIKNNFLCGVALLGQPVPEGEEWDMADAAITKLFNQAKENGLLTPGQPVYGEKVFDDLKKHFSSFENAQIEYLMDNYSNDELKMLIESKENGGSFEFESLIRDTEISDTNLEI